MNKPIRVAILVPHMGEVSMEWADRVYGPLKFIPVAEFEKVMFTCRGMPVHVARNILAEMALRDEKVTHMFWVDSDIVFENMSPNEAILQLLRCDVPIVSGIYRARQKQGFNLSAWMKHPQGYVPIVEFTGNWLTVSVIGFGCVLIQRQVFEAIPKPWFVWPEASPSEDFNFCELAAKYGFTVNVFTDVRCSHIGGNLKILSNGTVTTLDV